MLYCRSGLRYVYCSRYIKKKEYDSFQQMITQRSKGKPISYLIKKKFFWKYEFFINEKVLIPRPDTEIIIEQVLRIYKKKTANCKNKHTKSWFITHDIVAKMQLCCIITTIIGK